MRIDKLVFKAGVAANSAPLEINPARVTVFVGPNNGGKSASLKEIHHSLTNGFDLSVIFAEISHGLISREEMEAVLDRFLVKDYPVSSPGNVMLGYRGQMQEVHMPHLRNVISSGARRLEQYAYQTFLKHLVLNLGGENRLGMVSGAGSQNLRQAPQSSIAALFVDDALRKRVSKIVNEAFGQYLVIDPTSMGTLQYAFADVYPSDAVARSFGEESLQFFSESMPLSLASDGTKAFIGIITEVMAGTHDVLVIDEPEAFLHPALAYLLGREVTRNLADGKQMFVSTHSPHFLMGCMSVGMPVDIVRLTYKSKQATARLLPSTELQPMMNDPLLKSIGVVGALFFESAIVVEADSDRAFYEEINSRLNLYSSGGIRHASFLNAHNKQEAAHIARVLRNVGIPAAMILDIDWIKEDGKVAQRYFAAAGIPQGLRPGFLEMRRTVRASLEAKGGDFKMTGGISKLEGAELATAATFFDQMERYGIFTARNGELEHWLPDLGVVARKDLWLSAMFARLGSDPSVPDFVRPDDGDVWELVRRVGRWVADAAREGMDYVDPAEL